MTNSLLLRDYQSLTLNEIYDKFITKHQLVSTLGMGGGKTIIISEVAKYYYNNNKNIVILTNISELIPQIEEQLLLQNLPYNIIKSGEEYIENNNNCQITLIMEQSFHENFRKKNNTIKCDILIKDEYHIGKGNKRYEDIKMFLAPDNVLGLTGTPLDSMGFLMEGVELEDLILHGSVAELTRKGFLTPLKYLVPEWSTLVDYSSIKCTDDYSTSELEYKINTTQHNDLIIQSMNKIKAKTKKTLVYCNSIDHSNEIYNKLKKEGYKVGCVNSTKTKEYNDSVIHRYSLPISDINSIDCIVSVSKLTTGFNQPQAELLVLARPTKILRLYLQMIFRVARLYPNKKFGIILDLSQCVAEHGFGTQEINYIKSNRLTKSEKRKIKIDKKVESKLRLEAIKEITTNSTNNIEITNKKINVKLKELRVKNVQLKTTITKNLINIFKNTTDIELVTSIGFELNYRINKKTYEYKTVLEKIENYKIDYEDTKEINKNKYLIELKNKYQTQIKEKRVG